MVQQPRRDSPLYSCAVPVESMTGNLDEEAIAFDSSADAAQNAAKQLLINQYGCSPDQAQALLQHARIENLAPWCASDPPSS